MPVLDKRDVSILERTTIREFLSMHVENDVHYLFVLILRFQFISR